MRPWPRLRSALTIPGGLILLFHRVTTLPVDPQWLAVPPPLFEEQLQVVRRAGRVMALAELVGHVRRGRVPRRAIVVTFDDGYLDNLEHAKPLLERYDVPATVFVSSGGAERDREFFWDDLSRLLLPPGGGLRGQIHVTVGATRHSWTLDAAGDHQGWNVSLPPRTAAQRAYAELCALIKPLPDGARAEAVAQVSAQMAAPAVVRASHAMMTRQQWRELAAGGLIDVGAHTVTHPMLSQLPADAQLDELTSSKRDLEDVLERPVRSLAYPFGGVVDYDATTMALARDAGFDAACANVAGQVGRRSDLYQLPRVLVRDWPGEVLERRLEQWFRA